MTWWSKRDKRGKIRKLCNYFMACCSNKAWVEKKTFLRFIWLFCRTHHKLEHRHSSTDKQVHSFVHITQHFNHLFTRVKKTILQKNYYQTREWYIEPSEMTSKIVRTKRMKCHSWGRNWNNVHFFFHFCWSGFEMVHTFTFLIQKFIEQ